MAHAFLSACIATIGCLAAGPEDHAAPAGRQPAPDAARESRPIDPYTLGTCAVSGMKLGSMGDPIVKVFDQREVRFCCVGCVPKFAAEPEPYLAKVDKEMLKRQAAHYPLEKCVVNDDPMFLGDEFLGEQFIVSNRMFRTCCRGCIPKVKADPAKYAARLDKAAAEAQRARYPLSTCVVGGEALTAEAKEVVIANRLVRLCCAGCEKKLRADPVVYFAKLDKAAGLDEADG